ncbi:MAG: PIN domain-containing protein [bacterium]
MECQAKNRPYLLFHTILKLIEKRNFTLCTTPLLLEELRDVLSRPFFLTFIKSHSTSCEELIAALLEIVALYSDKKIDPFVKNDPDDRILACAIVSGAKSIITPNSFLNGTKGD